MSVVGISAMAHQLNLGWAKWMNQFAFGFPLVGEISQEFSYRRGDSLHSPPGADDFWRGSESRFPMRARASGHVYSEALWDDACDQVNAGWLDPTLPIDMRGNLATYESGSTNIACTFAVDRPDKLRACDDLRHSRVNL